jgi:predicted AAA+ superfamily ATPase
MYNMQGLSFREYLQLFHQISLKAYTLEEILGLKVEIPEIQHPLPLFLDYLRRGYYPFAECPSGVRFLIY